MLSLDEIFKIENNNLESLTADEKGYIFQVKCEKPFLVRLDRF